MTKTVHKAFSAAHVGNLRHQQPIRARGLKLTMYQVRAKIRALGLTRRNCCPTFALAGHSSTAYQPSCLLTADVNALTAQRTPHIPHPVDAATFGMHVTNMLYKGSLATATGA